MLYLAYRAFLKGELFIHLTYKIKHMKKIITLSLAFICILFLFHFILLNVEERECKRWETTDRAFSNWKIEQCQSFGIEL